MPEIVIHDGKTLVNSTDLAEHYLEQWTLRWQNQQAHAEIQEEFSIIRRMASDVNDLDAITGPQVTKAIKMIKHRTRH